MIQTQWNESFYKPGSEKTVKQTPAEMIISYLETNGPQYKGELIRALNLTHEQIRWAVVKLSGRLMSEVTGKANAKVCLYWVESKPPRPDQRCVTHKVFDWFDKNPWRPAVDIPSYIVPEQSDRHSFACNLEIRGRLISKVENHTKHYKVKS